MNTADRVKAIYAKAPHYRPEFIRGVLRFDPLKAHYERQIRQLKHNHKVDTTQLREELAKARRTIESQRWTLLKLQGTQNRVGMDTPALNFDNN